MRSVFHFYFSVGEESTNTPQQRELFSDFFKSVDPYKHPVVSHSVSTQKQATFGPLLGYPSFDGVSLNSEPEDIFAVTLEWIQRSAAAGRKWIVCSDEQSPPSVGVKPDSIDPQHDVIRKYALWGNIMSGGAYVFFLHFEHFGDCC